MFNIDSNKPKNRLGLKITLSAILGLLLIITATIYMTRRWYHINIRPLTNYSQIIDITIPSGSTSAEISQLLEDKLVIRSAKAFMWNLRSRTQKNTLLAGSYQLDSSLDIDKIIDILAEGKITSANFTILPGQRLDQLKVQFKNYGYSDESVEAAFNPNLYIDHPVLRIKPATSSLEGFLYPETFHIDANTKPEDIIKLSLDEMNDRLTAELVQKFQANGLTAYQGLILASIVEKELNTFDERSKAAQVFYKRIKLGMQLGSDVTFYYAAAITGEPPSPSLDSPYNTRLYTGLPPGPISNVSDTSLQAVANPAPTDFLYFVSGDDGNTYFSMTEEEHLLNAELHCDKLCEL